MPQGSPLEGMLGFPWYIHSTQPHSDFSGWKCVPFPQTVVFHEDFMDKLRIIPLCKVSLRRAGEKAG